MNRYTVTCIIPVVLILLMLGACTTWVPPPATDENVATIQIVSERFMHFVRILEIDGARTSALPATGLLNGPSQFKVTAGKHAFLVEGNSGAVFWRMKLWLEAEPKRTYYLRSENKGYSFKAWFLESGKAEPVGGSLPME